ncbi:MAG: hypothetical protein D6734_08900 [Candidatus Schekmanbacteria bacterium]|nr:MAG: hypothetical protein D6734_08900 [Candidatus Schekmanbacteria bacterium]
MKKIVTLTILIAFFLIHSSVGYAKTFHDYGPWGKGGLITASVLASVPYTPLKLAYAFIGGITSGMILAFTGGKATESASRIAAQASTGDWYVPPDVFLGSEYLDFVGPDDK